MLDVAREGARDVDIVPAVEQLLAPDRIDRETGRTVAPGHGLGREIDGHGQIGCRGERRQQILDILLGEDGRQDAVLDRVGGEDVAEGRRGDRDAGGRGRR